MSSDQAIYDHWDQAHDIGIQIGRNQAADAIIKACKHAVIGNICSPCIEAAAIARGMK